MIYKLVRNLVKKPTGRSLPVNVSLNQKRNFFEWLIKIWNVYDENRIKILGHERVAAEWLIRNGAAVKFQGESEFFFDYHGFPEYTAVENVPPRFTKKIVEIHAHESSLHHYGFKHFEHCKDIRKIMFDRCHYIRDEALDQLKILKNSLEHLELKSCFNVTDKGLRHLVDLSNLTTLVIHNLPEVEQKKETEKILRNGLKKCNITYEP